MCDNPNEPNIDVLFVQRSVWTSRTEDDAAVVALYRSWTDAIARSPIPVILVGDLMAEVSDFEAAFRKKTGIPAEIGGLSHGLAAFAGAASWAEFRDRHMARAMAPPVNVLPAAPLAGKVSTLHSASRGSWAEYAALEFLGSTGVPVIPWKLAKSADEAVAAADKFGYPVVVKISSSRLPHKSAIGGVILAVPDAGGVRTAFNRVVDAAHRYDATIKVDGALVMPFRKGALEVIVGIVRDPTWGLVLAVGLGGVWTEVLSDTNITPLPVSVDEVKRLLTELRGARLFSGGHGLSPVNLDKLADVIVRIAAGAAVAGDDLESLEVNPLRASGDEIEALDSLIVWRDRRGRTVS